MFRNPLSRWSLTLLLALGPNAATRAATVLSNLAQPAQDSVEVISFNSWQASSFQLAESASPYRVNSVTLRLRQIIPNSSLVFRIVGESGQRPDMTNVQVELGSPVFTGSTTQSVTLTAGAGSKVLQPGQRYWLVGSVHQLDYDATSPNGLIYWSYSNNYLADASPAAGWTFGTQVATSGANGSNWGVSSATPFTFSVDGTVVVPPAAGMTLAGWRSLNPGGPADNATFLATDHDNNGLTGLLDFAFNAKRANLPKIVRDQSGNLVFEYVRWIQAPELAWKIQRSSTLASGSWQTATGYPTTTTAVDSLSEIVRVQLPAPGPGTPAQHFRVMVEKL